MFRYILKRLLLFIPLFFIISLLTFIISTSTPGDPAQMMISGRGGIDKASPIREKAYRDKRHALGLDLPVFYFSISSRAIPDTLMRIPDKRQRSALRSLAYRYGNWENIAEEYLTKIKDLEFYIYNSKSISNSGQDGASVKENLT